MKGLISASKGMRAVLVSVRGTIKKITIIYSVSVGVVSLDVTPSKLTYHKFTNHCRHPAPPNKFRSALVYGLTAYGLTASGNNNCPLRSHIHILSSAYTRVIHSSYEIYNSRVES